MSFERWKELLKQNQTGGATDGRKSKGTAAALSQGMEPKEPGQGKGSNRKILETEGRSGGGCGS